MAANWMLCINPFCTEGADGGRAMVNRVERTSGACCRKHMRFCCGHPDCVKKAQELGHEFYTHPWGTKIAEKHTPWRVDGAFLEKDAHATK